MARPVPALECERVYSTNDNVHSWTVEFWPNQARPESHYVRAAHARSANELQRQAKNIEAPRMSFVLAPHETPGEGLTRVIREQVEKLSASAPKRGRSPQRLRTRRACAASASARRCGWPSR